MSRGVAGGCARTPTRQRVRATPTPASVTINVGVTTVRFQVLLRAFTVVTGGTPSSSAEGPGRAQTAARRRRENAHAGPARQHDVGGADPRLDTRLENEGRGPIRPLPPGRPCWASDRAPGP